MPIVDYARIARLAEISFFSYEAVSGSNKRLVKKFLEVYDVSPARKAIFLKHIALLLRRTKDIGRDMNDRSKTNKVFKQLRSSVSVSYYSTIVNVSLRFVRWLNDGVKPVGFKDVANVPKSKQRRQLTPNDMVTWEEGLRLIDATNNVMLKALVATQLDGGFRPSEFVDLNYGDVERKGDFAVVRINGGKTGVRNVVLWRAVPHLLRWMQSHPTKRKSDPLWVQEFQVPDGTARYD